MSKNLIYLLGKNFKNFVDQGKIPKDIPINVQSTYKDQGWVSMWRLLGSIHRHQVNYISFK